MGERREGSRARRRVVALLAAAAAIGPGAAVARAAPRCPGVTGPAVPVARGGTGASIEALAVDDQGRLYLSDNGRGAVLRIDRPGALPRALARVDAPGGIVVQPDGTLLVGTGNGQTALLAALFPQAGVVRVDPATGAVTPLARGLGMANGVTQDDHGNVYATSLYDGAIDRIAPDGRVRRAWASVPTANGIAVDAARRQLFVSRSVLGAGISRVSLDPPYTVRPYATAGLLDLLAFPDGLTMDDQGRPVVATFIGGEVWRVGPGGSICALASGLPQSTSVVFGRGSDGFAAGHLYRAGYDGTVYEIPVG
ncbi:SMP-30/gluconolactonase/LRE family protein [Patulibacter defluvii]|uniref:SMP-30/gluconolactonase/LRE family protein n=1 Tax=Patulibacter defluvii TaxID=3095358 RepID=UPI002A75067A|nr:SMP-30/gluconolactonase/LRE family protein [Patulibacter sp. DM4]